MVISQLFNKEWEVLLSFCKTKAVACYAGLTHQQAFWRRACLPWIHDEMQIMSTTGSVVFVGNVLESICSGIPAVTQPDDV